MKYAGTKNTKESNIDCKSYGTIDFFCKALPYNIFKEYLDLIC